MDTDGTPYRRSWSLYIQALAFAWVVGPAMAYAGFYLVQTSEIIVVIIGGLMLLCGPILVVAAPFMPRPGYGNCPSCAQNLIDTSGGHDPLLCPKCAAYARVDGDQLKIESMSASRNEPAYWAALPWNDIAGVAEATVAFSAQDYLQDKLSGWMAKKDGVRVVEKWPELCCVCGGKPAQNLDHAVKVLLMGRLMETHCMVVAKGVPYCAQHKDGLGFGRVSYAMGTFGAASAPPSFGIKFRSHVFREGFRKLNPHKFPTEAEGPLKIRRIGA